MSWLFTLGVGTWLLAWHRLYLNRSPKAIALALPLFLITRSPVLPVVGDRITAFDCVFAWMLLGAAFEGLSRRRMGKPLKIEYPPWTTPTLGLVVLMATSLLQVANPSSAVVETAVYLFLLLVGILVANALKDLGDYSFVFRTYLIASSLVAGIIVYQFLGYALDLPLIFPQETFQVYGPFKNPNQAGSALMIAVPVIIRQIFSPVPIVTGPGALVMLGLHVSAIAFTVSRTSMVVTAVVTLLALSWPVTASHTFTRRRLILVAVTLFTPAIAFLLAWSVGSPAVNYFIWRVGESLYLLSGTLAPSASVNLFRDIPGMALKYFAISPILGVGTTGFRELSPIVDAWGGAFEIHGTYLGILAETGVLGMLLLMTIVGMGLRGAVRLTRCVDMGHRELAIGLLLALLGLGLTGIWDTFLRKRQFWILLGLISAMSRSAASLPEAGKAAES